MHTRRDFLQTAARAAVPAAVTAGAVPLLAQGPPARRGQQAALLGQITAELARLHRAARATPPRGEHARQAASTLRLLAALDLDAEVHDGLVQLLATRGHPPDPFTLISSPL